MDLLFNIFKIKTGGFHRFFSTKILMCTKYILTLQNIWRMFPNRKEVLFIKGL